LNYPRKMLKFNGSSAFFSFGKVFPRIVGFNIVSSSRAVSLFHFSTVNENNKTVVIKKVGVVGLGLMGHGIAQLSAQNGFEVVAIEQNQSLLDQGLKRIKNSLSKIAEKQVQAGKLDSGKVNVFVNETIAHIKPTTFMPDLSDCDLIIEAIIENLDIKKETAKQLGQLLKPGGIIASNTSSLPITDVALASGRPTHVVGIHFFNPVQIMKLVEVVRTQHTLPEVFENSFEFVKKIGKVAIACQDTPGFVVNRLLVPYLSQSILMLERGDASKEDIDTGMKLGAGHPMGPIQLADYVGLDTCLFILEGWIQRFPNETQFHIPNLLREKVKEGKLGRKSGEGFYKWSGDKIISN